MVLASKIVWYSSLSLSGWSKGRGKTIKIRTASFDYSVFFTRKHELNKQIYVFVNLLTQSYIIAHDFLSWKYLLQDCPFRVTGFSCVYLSFYIFVSSWVLTFKNFQEWSRHTLNSFGSPQNRELKEVPRGSEMEPLAYWYVGLAYIFSISFWRHSACPAKGSAMAITAIFGYSSLTFQLIVYPWFGMFSCS